MSDPGHSSFDPEPSCSNIIILENNEPKVNDSVKIKTRGYRPAPASKKRKREEENHDTNNMELFNICKPLSVKLQRLSQQVISKMVKKCDQASRAKRRNRWKNGLVHKCRKKTKTEKSTEKAEILDKSEKSTEKSEKFAEQPEKSAEQSVMPAENSEKSAEQSKKLEKYSESNKICDSSPMASTHPWGCCRMIPFERNRSRSHRKFSLNKNSNSIASAYSQQEVSKDEISEDPAPKMFLRGRKPSHEDKCSSSKAKEKEVSIDIAKNHNSHSTPSLSVKENRRSVVTEASTSKLVEDEFVCRRTIPYIRKTKCKPVFNLQINDTAQAGGSKNSTALATSVQTQDPTLKESKPKTSKGSSNRETNISGTEKSPDCSKTKPFIFKDSEKERNHQELSNNSKTFDTCEKLSELQSRVCKKTDETKAPEPNIVKEADDDEHMEDNNFSWNSSNMWKYKRKHRSRRISSSSSSDDESCKKKIKTSPTLECNTSNKRRPGPSSTPGRFKSHSALSAIQTLCPPSCTNKEHHSNFFNFLYKKPKVIPLKEGRVILQRLEEIENDPDVIRWRNSLIKLEKEDVEENLEDLDDSRYYVMYDDGTVSNEVLSQEAIYQMHEMTDFNTVDESSQVYEKVNTYENINPYENQLISSTTLDMSKFFNNAVDESQHLENHMHQADLPRDDELTDDHLLRDDDDVPLEFSEYPKILLIRLEAVVGSLESEYSASEIENLEVKYIDFMMNSNFSYDKQSQSFFQVYKRLHAKRAARELEMLNDDRLFDVDEEASDLHEKDETDSRDDDVDDENPLVIAMDAEKENPTTEECASDESSNNSVSADIHASSINHDSKVATITPRPEDVNQNLRPSSENNEIISTEFVTCDDIPQEQEYPEEELLYITCKLCKVSFRNLQTFSLHKTDCYAKNKKPYKCEYCNNFYKSRRNMKLHVQSVHGKGDSILEKQNTSDSAVSKTSSSGPKRKKIQQPAQKNLFCGVCSVEFESKQSLWDHILMHTEQELQDAYKDATKNIKNQELQEKLRRIDERKKEKELGSTQNKHQKKDSKQSSFKYAQWKDRILYKISSNDEASKNPSTSRDSIENQTEEIILSSSESDNCEQHSSVIKHTKSIQNEAGASTKAVTMCPCHKNDTSMMVNGDMQIEMVLLCKICQVLFRRLDCFEVHYRVNRLCNMDRSSRSPKLFCSSCQIILSSLPEMRSHLEKHARVNRQGHVTFLCNICKVMFFGIGSLFYSHWFNHNKDISFLASRYSFPKLSIVQTVNTVYKSKENQKEEYLFVAEYVCKECKVPFGSELDLEKHVCSKPPAAVPVSEKPQEIQVQPKRDIIVRISCMVCKGTFANKQEYNAHEEINNHLQSTKPEYICVSSNSTEKAYICTQCKTVRMSIEDLKEHWKMHRPLREKFTCANCPQVSSSIFEEIENHCKSCFTGSYAECLASLMLVVYVCRACNLHFETAKECIEHRQMCKTTISFHKAYTKHSELGYVPVIPAASPSTAPAVVSSAPPTIAAIITTTTTPTPSPNAATNVVAVTPSISSSNQSFRNILPVPKSSKSKVSPLLEKYLKLSLTPKPKSKSKRQVNEDVEVIDILSESSSRSSLSEVYKEACSVTGVASRDKHVVNTDKQSSNVEADPFDSYVPGNLQSEYQRKNVSVSKAIVCYPAKKKGSKDKPATTPQIPTNMQESTTNQENTTNQDAERANVAMTVVNPEFEVLLSKCDDLESNIDPLKNSNNLRNFRKKSTTKQSNLGTYLLNTARQENTSMKRVSVEDVHSSEDVSPSVMSEITSSSKGAEKSPLPFEIVLLPEDEAASPKPDALSQTSTAQVDTNSSKLSNSVSDKNSINEKVTNDESTSKDTLTEPNTSSVIEEYIEYIEMDEITTDNPKTQAKTATPDPAPTESTAQVEKVAPTRLRVKTLAELQEIKMHLCDTCGQSFDAKKSFDDHAREKNCQRVQPKFVEPALPTPPRLPNYRESFQDSMQSRTATEIDVEAALRQNLIRRGALPANMDYIPPLVPLAIQQLNASTSKANMTPVSPNLVIPDPKRRQSMPFRTYSNNTGVIPPSRINNSSSHSVPRSGAIQLPERTGVSVLKRPSGAATRIQNLSHPQRSQAPNEIHHRGLPQTYAARQPGRINSLTIPTRLPPPPPYPSSGPTTISTPENQDSLSCTACNNFTAKNVVEFSNHLIMHLMSRVPDAVNQGNDHDLRNLEGQPIDSALRNSPNTSGYQNSPIAASDVYNERSTMVTGGWQTPARYIYACKLCVFQTESKASIRLHEKNHSTVAVMRQKNLQRLQNHKMIQQAFQVQQQRQKQSQQLSPTLAQLMESRNGNLPNANTSAEQNTVALYNSASVDNNLDVYQCQLCNNYPFATQEEFTRHLELSHKESRNETAKEPTDTSAVFFVCDYCETPKIFETEETLRKHMNFLHNYLCPICSLRCTSRERLTNHLMMRHQMQNQPQ